MLLQVCYKRLLHVPCIATGGHVMLQEGFREGLRGENDGLSAWKRWVEVEIN